MTGGPFYAETPDEASNDVDDDEEELAVGVSRLARVDQDEFDETPLPPLVHSLPPPLIPTCAPPDHIQPNSPDTSTSLAQFSNPEPPEPHTPTPLRSHLAAVVAAPNLPNDSHDKAPRARHGTPDESDVYAPEVPTCIQASPPRQYPGF